jgi:hypothetical protein
MDGMRTKAFLTCFMIALLAIGMIDLGVAVPTKKAFQFSGWGYYKAVDIQGKTYFAGYDSGYLYQNSNTKTLSGDLISEVLKDSNTEWKISTYVPLVLAQGYQLHIESLDVDGNKAYLGLYRDGSLVDSKVIQPSINDPTMSDQTYFYKSTIDNAKDIIQIAVHSSKMFIAPITSILPLSTAFGRFRRMCNLRRPSVHHATRLSAISSGAHAARMAV